MEDGVVVQETEVSQGESTSQGTEIPAKETPGTKEWYQSQHDKAVKQNELLTQQLQQVNGQLQQYGQEIEKIKNPPKPQEVLVEPVEPDFRQFGYQDENTAMADGNYQAAVLRYNRDLTKYTNKIVQQQKAEQDGLRQTLAQEQENKKNQQQFESFKAKFIGGLVAQEVPIEEATKEFETYWRIVNSDPENGAALVANNWKARTGKSIAPPPVAEEKPKFPLPAGIGGGGKPPVNTEGFTKPVDNSWITKTG